MPGDLRVGRKERLHLAIAMVNLRDLLQVIVGGLMLRLNDHPPMIGLHLNQSDHHVVIHQVALSLL